MRVLHVNSSARVVGGVEVYLRDLFDGLSEVGVESILAYGMGEGSAFPGARFVEGMNDTSLIARRDRGYRAMRAVLSELRPDVVHFHAVNNQNVIAACLEAAPTLLHLHDYRYLCPASSFHFRATETNCSLKAGAHCVLRGCVSHCVSRRPDVSVPALQRVRWAVRNLEGFSSILANSTHVRNRLLSAGGPASTSSVLHYFCSYGAPASMPSPSDPPYVLFVGRIVPLKGIEDFVRCVGMLPADVRGVMVGEGMPEHLELVRQVAAQVGCGGRIEIIPWKSRPEVARIVSGATATVFPSIWEEPFGLVGIESQVLGVPVVGYGHGGATDWLEDGVTGLSVAPRDAAGLAAGVRRIMQDQGLRSRLVHSASQRAIERFGKRHHLEKLLRHYQSSRGLRPA
jgi:glycosyltransferase involved in cell wall biosynthesis